MGEDLGHPQLLQGSAKLGGPAGGDTRPFLGIGGPELKGSMAVSVHAQGNSTALDHPLQQQEVAPGFLLLLEEGIGRSPGGGVHCQQ